MSFLFPALFFLLVFVWKKGRGWSLFEKIGGQRVLLEDRSGFQNFFFWKNLENRKMILEFKSIIGKNFHFFFLVSVGLVIDSG